MKRKSLSLEALFLYINSQKNQILTGLKMHKDLGITQGYASKVLSEISKTLKPTEFSTSCIGRNKAYVFQVDVSENNLIPMKKKQALWDTRYKEKKAKQDIAKIDPAITITLLTEIRDELKEQTQLFKESLEWRKMMDTK